MSRVEASKAQKKQKNIIAYKGSIDNHLKRLCQQFPEVKAAWNIVSKLLRDNKFASLKQSWSYHYLDSEEYSGLYDIHLIDDQQQVDDLLVLVRVVDSRNIFVSIIGSHPELFPRGIGAQKSGEFQQKDPNSKPKYDID